MSKVAVITGATSGIGRELTLKLIEENTTVIALGRSAEKIEQLIKDATPLLKDNFLFVVKGDLSDQESINQIGRDMIGILEENQFKIDYLIHVAGRVTSGYRINKDHHEMTFAVNHLAVVQLTYLLINKIKKSLKSRILVVSSQSHYRANINFDNLETKTYYTILRSYKRSKLYNVLFVKALAKRFPKVPVYAIDPGLVRTKIGSKGTSKISSFIWNWRSKKGIHPRVAAIHMYNVLSKDRFDDLTGAYVKHGEPISANPVVSKEDVVDKLWNISLEMLEIKEFFTKK